MPGPERIERIFRMGCIALAALLALRLGLAVRHATLLHGAVIPELPRLAADAESNSPAAKALPSPEANKDARMAAGVKNRTNAAALGRRGTNTAATNAPGAAPSRPVIAGIGGPKDDLPKAVKAQVDKVVQSGILAPYMPPMPAALLGIADDEAFLRAGNGQTGVLKEGGELGGLKLLRIGVNRVLIEENGEKKELMVFGGAGGESLMAAPTNAPPPAAATTTNHQTAGVKTKPKGREKS